jgi:hypothetical protein
MGRDGRRLRLAKLIKIDQESIHPHFKPVPDLTRLLHLARPQPVRQRDRSPQETPHLHDSHGY